MTWNEGVQFRHKDRVPGQRGPVEGTFIGRAGLKHLSCHEAWTDRENPPWTGPSLWHWSCDQVNIPEDFRDPRRDL
jgi:hypothetical protein